MIKPLIGIIGNDYLNEEINQNKNFKYIMNNINVDFVDIYYDDCSLKSILKQVNKCDAIIQIGSNKNNIYDELIYYYIVKKNIPYLGTGSSIEIMGNYSNRKANRKEIVFNQNIPVFHNKKERNFHSIDLYEGTLLKNIINKKMILVNSNHNHALIDEGVNVVSAKSLDGVIEAIENPTCDFNIGLQWNPEKKVDNSDNMKIFDKLSNTAYIYRLKK